MTIKELHSDTKDEWLDFFDNRAFEDHSDWRNCYCTAFHSPRPANCPCTSKKRRDYAAWMIEAGRMTGYLAFEEGRVVGWVNANSKNQYARLSTHPGSGEKILSIVCFIVEKEHRGKGIATALLQRIIADATARGYSIIEAYPKKGASPPFGTWNGPFAMYAKAGFTEDKVGTEKVVRKYLHPHTTSP